MIPRRSFLIPATTGSKSMAKIHRGELTVYADGKTYVWSAIANAWVVMPERKP